MSSATWRNVFTLLLNRFNKYSQIAARALRSSLKEGERVAAEKRGLTILRYQHWENGQGGPQTYLVPPAEATAPKKSAAV
ncbi:mitochondrial ATP synthase epsilon chain-domain-containing protein [Trametes gibbosa]|nr:mitochondrial ATP synthase epsilon chain-domain-containing protein [Trametes gibbosa]